MVRSQERRRRPLELGASLIPEDFQPEGSQFCFNVVRVMGDKMKQVLSLYRITCVHVSVHSFDERHEVGESCVTNVDGVATRTCMLFVQVRDDPFLLVLVEVAHGTLVRSQLPVVTHDVVLRTIASRQHQVTQQTLVRRLATWCYAY